MTSGRIPYLPIVVAFCIAAIAGYAVFSGYAVFYAKDATMTGDVIGTWKSFAVLAFGFWLGSSSGGKAKDEAPPKVQIEQPADSPVPVEETR
jgi:hypothetical protein